MLSTLVNSVLLMGILILIGIILEKKKILTDEVEMAITTILLNVALPMLVINSFNLQYSTEKLGNGLKVLLIALINAIIVMIVNYFLVKKTEDIEKRKILLYTGVNPNCAFMGFPIIYQIYGAEGIFFASMYYIPMVIYMWTYGMAIFFDKISKREIKQMLLNINMIAVYIGLAIFILPIRVPELFENIMSTVGGITTPLAMFIIGAKMSRVNLRENFHDFLVYYGSIIRLIILPIIIIIMLKLVNVDPMIEGVVLIMASLPPATMTVIMSNKFNCEVEFASKLVVFAHMLSLITIPLIYFVYISL